MKSERMDYESPKLTIHGSVEDLTQKGGGSFIDMPIGTPVTNISDVTSG